MISDMKVDERLSFNLVLILLNSITTNITQYWFSLLIYSFLSSGEDSAYGHVTHNCISSWDISGW